MIEHNGVFFFNLYLGLSCPDAVKWIYESTLIFFIFLAWQRDQKLSKPACNSGVITCVHVLIQQASVACVTGVRGCYLR